MFAFEALGACRFWKWCVAFVGRWIRGNGTIASLTSRGELLTIRTRQLNGMPTYAGSSGAVKEIERMDVSGWRGVDCGIIWCWRLVEAVRTLFVRSRVLPGSGYAAKLRDVGRLVRCIGCAGVPKAGLRAREKSTFVVQDIWIVAVVIGDRLKLMRTEMVNTSMFRLLFAICVVNEDESVGVEVPGC